MLTLDRQSVESDLNAYLHGQISSELHMLGQEIYQPFETSAKPAKIGEGVITETSDFLLREFVNQKLFEEIGRSPDKKLSGAEDAQAYMDQIDYRQLKAKVSKKAMRSGLTKIGNYEMREAKNQLREKIRKQNQQNEMRRITSQAERDKQKSSDLRKNLLRYVEGSGSFQAL